MRIRKDCGPVCIKDSFVSPVLCRLWPAPRRVATYRADGSVYYEAYPGPGASLEIWYTPPVSIVLAADTEEEE
jgi:hypothetical protein